MKIYFKSPDFLPPLKFFYALANCDLWVAVDHQKYAVRGRQGACKIKSDTNHYTTVRVPIRYPANRPLNQIMINNFLPWKKRMVSTIKNSYEKAEYYEVYADDLENHLKSPTVLLETLNLELILWLAGLLHISCTYAQSRVLCPNHKYGRTQTMAKYCKKFNAEPFENDFETKDAEPKTLSTLHYIMVFGAEKCRELLSNQ